ncbi:glycoside hydrolase family 76 protein [Paenarthrobacter sp. NPDC089675]|uniref:glycoside hydrolase family 76 protein n=1 Tax=Paenarthrobacter sp. NPDC089675 TaxID=3364376 RepID=UPI00382A0F45
MPSNAEPSTQSNPWADRADQEARSVTRTFGKRLFFLPGTHLGAIRVPKGPGSIFGPWHYWWQAHYVDCLVDTGRRELAAGRKFDGDSRPSAGRLASRLVTTIRLRNRFRFINHFYDDMAWLALSTLRLEKLAEETRNPGRRRNAYVRKSLTLQFNSAATEDLGGGTFWSTGRDFKNTPSTAPIALYFARTGHRDKARSLVAWLNAKLLDSGSGLYMDGLRIREGQVVLESAVYTYNQGPILGALLELGEAMDLERAAQLIEAVARDLTVIGTGGPGETGAVRGDGTGDGGLFTGILVRYLALAARDERLPEATRAVAAELVLNTAGAFWSGRREEEVTPATKTRRLIFSYDPQRPASETYPPGAGVELSTQLQAWMTFEAAATLPAT